MIIERDDNGLITSFKDNIEKSNESCTLEDPKLIDLFYKLRVEVFNVEGFVFFNISLIKD